MPQDSNHQVQERAQCLFATWLFGSWRATLDLNFFFF